MVDLEPRSSLRRWVIGLVILGTTLACSAEGATSEREGLCKAVEEVVVVPAWGEGSVWLNPPPEVYGEIERGLAAIEDQADADLARLIANVRDDMAEARAGGRSATDEIKVSTGAVARALEERCGVEVGVVQITVGG